MTALAHRFAELARLDRGVLLVASLLLGMGLIMVGSASVAVADRGWNDPGYFFDRQMMYASVGLLMMLVVLNIPLALYQRWSYALLGLSLLSLLLVLLPGVGVSVNGAQRWIDLGPVRLQASEFARLGLFIYVAAYAVRHKAALRAGGWGMLKPLVPIIVAALLLLMEPDFGATAVILAVVFAFLFVAGAPAWHCAVLVTAGAVGLYLLIVFEPYRFERLLSYRDPWAEAFDSGFQLTQSLIAIGRGHLFGEGLGNSVQKLLYLPETHTDFIFAIFAEEFGLFGVLLLLAGFALLLLGGWRIAHQAYENGQEFAGHLSILLSFWLVMQAGLNLAVNMGLVPTKGLPLPFFSYGGSHLLACWGAIALFRGAGLEAETAGDGP
ncbi:MAG: putative lipid II flippase FtsW [Oceanococcaceae bacterium]